MTNVADPQVLVVGAGPAGLAAALAMGERGVRGIAVIERDDAPGGLPRFCRHPGFGWEYARRIFSGPGFVRHLLERLKPFDVPIHCGVTMLSLQDGPSVTLTGPSAGYRTMRPRAVIVAAGIREASRGNRVIVGARPELGVLTTGQLQQSVARGLRFPDRMRRLVVVGTEHVAFSVVWTAREAGMKVTTMLGMEERVMSFAPAGWLARLAGIDIRLGCTSLEIEGDARCVTGLVVSTPRGYTRITCDGVIFTGSWIPEVAAFAGGGPEIDPLTGGLLIDQAMRTSIPGVFAAGNVLHPVESSGWAALEGRRAGHLVAEYLAGSISARQGSTRIETGPGLRYAVPQRWDETLPPLQDAPKLRPAVRSSSDVARGRVTLRAAGNLLWQGRSKQILRSRRLTLDLAALAGGTGQGDLMVDVEVSR